MNVKIKGVTGELIGLESLHDFSPSKKLMAYNVTIKIDGIIAKFQNVKEDEIEYFEKEKKCTCQPEYSLDLIVMDSDIKLLAEKLYPYIKSKYHKDCGSRINIRNAF